MGAIEMTRKLVGLGLLPLVLGVSTTAVAEDCDIKAGKAAFEATCATCHYQDDFAGESKDSILGMIKGVASGEVEHEAELKGLSEEDIANLASFFASFK